MVDGDLNPLMLMMMMMMMMMMMIAIIVVVIMIIIVVIILVKMITMIMIMIVIMIVRMIYIYICVCVSVYVYVYILSINPEISPLTLKKSHPCTYHEFVTTHVIHLLARSTPQLVGTFPPHHTRHITCSCPAFAALAQLIFTDLVAGREIEQLPHEAMLGLNVKSEIAHQGFIRAFGRKP